MKATLLVRGGVTDKKEYPLMEGKSYLIGRSRDADVIVKDKLASRNHCKLASTGGDEWAVSDLGSSNGTFVNRQRVTTCTLKNGDSIQVGKAIMEFRLLSATTAPTVVTGEPGREGEPAIHEAVIRPAGLQPTARLQPTPPPEAPKPKEVVDEDIRGLFEFLDKVGKGGKPSEEKKEPGLGANQTARPRPGEEAPPAGKRAEGGEQLFSLLDDQAEAKPLPGKPAAHPPPPLPPAPPPPPQPPAAEQGGLLAFLRKKKQQP